MSPANRVTVLRFAIDVTVPITFSEEARQTVRREILGTPKPKNQHHDHPVRAPLLEGMKDIITARLGDLADGNDNHSWIKRIGLVVRHENL